MENLFGVTKELTRTEKLRKSRKATNEFQKWVIDWLNDSGQFKVWRNNNIPSTRHQIVTNVIHAFDKEGNPIEIITEHVKVNFKKNQKTVSTFDVIGFRKKDGLHLEIEIKVGKDTLDTDQKDHMNDLHTSKCVSFAVGDKYTFEQQISRWMDAKTLAF